MQPIVNCRAAVASTAIPAAAGTSSAPLSGWINAPASRRAAKTTARKINNPSAEKPIAKCSRAGNAQRSATNERLIAPAVELIFVGRLHARPT